MKLSVSAYRAQASAHKKILSNYQQQLSYGTTNQVPIVRKSSDLSSILLGLKVNRSSNDEIHGSELVPPPVTYYCRASSSRMGPGPDSDWSSAPSSIPHSLATSRDEEDDEDEENSSHRFNGHGGSRSIAEVYQCSMNKSINDNRLRIIGEFTNDNTGVPVTLTISNSLDSDSSFSKTPVVVRKSQSTRGSQKWSNVRAVMALYSSLRKIKRTKSNQRWMKLRTTVQLSSAISTIQKKPPLKREDSFLKRFSTRQIPESQETIDTGDGEGDTSDDRSSTRRHRRPRRPQRPPKTVVNPDENFYYYWLMLLSSCVLYNLWTLIVRQSMPELQDIAPAVWLSCDGFTDLVFFLDLGVQFRTGYLEQGLMVYNSKKLAGHYFKSKSFILDLLSLLPLDLLQVNLGSNPMLRFPRFLKVYRVYNYYYMVESRTVYPNLWRVLNLIHILLILAHWFGCFYYLLSEAEGFHGDWVYPYRPGEYATLTRKYLGSLYWSTLTLTTIGDLPTPETNAEYVFTIVSYLIGVFIFATIVGQVGNVITNRNANRLEFERLLDGAKTYMRHHKVPGGMKRRVLRWYDYSWSRGRIQGGGDINTALGLLPDKLKTELALHVNLSVLKKVTIFQECQPEFLHDLVLKMKAYIFTPGDSICRKGEVAREMFIIADGILEVISETGRVLTTMKAGDFFGEIGILNLDGLNKRTADVRSVGYSELFSLSREDVLAALKDYPEAQEILQKLGEKRLREAQRVVRSFQNPPSPNHDSSDNSTGKRIVDKLKSDVKGLKNALKKSRRNTRHEESLELQPLTSKLTQLRRQTRIEETQDICIPCSEPPVSPIGAGLPLLSRLRILKEKQEREEKKNLMETNNPTSEQTQTTEYTSNIHSISNTTTPVPLLHRILHVKSKADADTVVDRENMVIKEPLNSEKIIPEKNEMFISTDRSNPKGPKNSSILMIQSSSASRDSKNSINRKPWAMLKDASIKTTNIDIHKHDSQHPSISPRITAAQKLQIHQNFVQLKQKTKMYTSIDDLSPEYCGLPFVKKLKILNERQKLAELEKVVRSSSLDCSESTELVFNNLTRSHSEACAIDYAYRLGKLNKKRRGPTLISPDQHSSENETLERQNLKSILKKLSTGSRAESSETSVTSTPDREAVSAELKKLMRAPTLEGFAARHSKLSKSVTFNKYTMQSPPGNEAKVTDPNATSISSSSLSSLLTERAIVIIDQEQRHLASKPTKLCIHSLHNGKILPSQIFPRLRDDDYISELISDIKIIIQSKLDVLKNNFKQQFNSLELEIRRRDEIISQLQARILEFEKLDSGNDDDEESIDDTTEQDISLEAELIDDTEDHPFMRDSSIDTVFTTRSNRGHPSPYSISNSFVQNRLSWEEHSEEETLELQDLPRSITPQSLWMGDVTIDVESSDESENAPVQNAFVASIRRVNTNESNEVINENNHNNWEMAMLAEELEKKRRSNECSSSGS